MTGLIYIFSNPLLVDESSIIFVTLKYQFYNGREKEVVHGIKEHAKVLLDEIMGTGKWSSSFIV